jgi:hypothetical protein
MAMVVQRSQKEQKKLAGARQALLKVGRGRGFVVEINRERYVITAAHCLPKFPPCHPNSHTEERTYRRLLGPLEERLTVWAECRFVDPVSDIAVLCSPDGDEFFEEAEAWTALVENATALSIGDLSEQATVWLPYLDGSWERAKATHWKRSGWGIYLTEAARNMENGMSGSPIVTIDGIAVGVFSITTSITRGEGGPQARLRAHLPGWLLFDDQRARGARVRRAHEAGREAAGRLARRDGNKQ